MLAEELLEDLVEEGREDHIGLWEIVRAVREDLEVSDTAEVRQVALQLITTLLQRGSMQAGFPTPDGRGFIPWKSGHDETIDRIGRGWDLLGRDPTIGEIVWFNTPDSPPPHEVPG